jgi:branched-chain amino acid transport system ATP-binding protein
MLRTEGISKSFGGFVAVRDVNISVERGRTACVIGPNGAGKSTLFNLITGHIEATRGRVMFGDKDITGQPPHTICRMGIGRSFQRTNIFPRLTVFDNVQIAVLSHLRRTLNLMSPARGMAHDETMAVLDAVGLAGEQQSTSGTLSYGLQKQLELGIALASDPQVLLLDEPTAGMSPQETADTIALIGRIVRDRGLTLLFTEHDMDVVFSIAERITVLHQGAVLAEGTPEEVQRNEDVQRIYLGEDDA